jgi:DNA (cytosine-5)-methyltransferase 1
MAGGTIRYLSVCSGIEAATVAWHPLGWEAAAFSEIEAFPRAVLKHHYPEVPLHGDFTTIGADEYGPIDLLVGGTPCQSFSVAGLRGGMDDERGQLALQFLKLLDRTRARWVVWENVPGVLSSNGGRDFGSFLGGLVELGYGFAYRVLDAQHFGVPQRRRRVFVVGHLGDWRRAAAVLFERHSLSGHPAPRREKGQGTAAGANDGVVGSLCADSHPGAYSGQDAYTGRLIAHSIRTAQTSSNGWGIQEEVSHTLDQANGLAVAHTLRGEGFDASEDGTGRGTPLVPCYGLSTQQEPKWADDLSPTLTVPSKSGGGQPTAVCFTAKDYGADASEISPTLRSGSHSGSHANGGVMPAVAFDLRGREDGSQFEGPHDTANIRAASGGSSRSYVAQSAVRRLTPEECEALQGFPRLYTAVPYRGKPAADGPRYKALGNSMAVPVMRWIGERIAIVDGRRMAETTQIGLVRSTTSDGAKQSPDSPIASMRAA